MHWKSLDVEDIVGTERTRYGGDKEYVVTRCECEIVVMILESKTMQDVIVQSGAALHASAPFPLTFQLVKMSQMTQSRVKGHFGG